MHRTCPSLSGNDCFFDDRRSPPPTPEQASTTRVHNQRRTNRQCHAQGRPAEGAHPMDPMDPATIALTLAGLAERP